MTHTPDHDQWGQDGRCEAVVTLEDGTVARCGYEPSGLLLNLDSPPTAADAPPGVESSPRRNPVTVVLAVVITISLALSWYTFLNSVTRGSVDAYLVIEVVFRIVLTVAFGALVSWMWRRG